MNHRKCAICDRSNSSREQCNVHHRVHPCDYSQRSDRTWHWVSQLDWERTVTDLNRRSDNRWTDRSCLDSDACSWSASIERWALSAITKGRSSSKHSSIVYISDNTIDRCRRVFPWSWNIWNSPREMWSIVCVDCVFEHHWHSKPTSSVAADLCRAVSFRLARISRLPTGQHRPPVSCSFDWSRCDLRDRPTRVLLSECNSGWTHMMPRKVSPPIDLSPLLWAGENCRWNSKQG